MSKKITTTTTTTTVVTTTTANGPKEIYDFFVLDKSGSMESVRQSTINGFNEYVQMSRKAASGDNVKSFVYLLQFSTDFHLTYNGVPASEVKELNMDTYKPDGGTSLNDATAKAIGILQNRLAGREQDPNVDVNITIQTDGDENSSTEFPKNSHWDRSNYKLTELIKKVRAWGWQVNFVGAGDPTQVKTYAANTGIDLSNVKSYNSNSLETTELFRDLGNARVTKSRAFMATGAKCSTGYFSNSITPTVDATDTTIQSAPTVSKPDSK